MARCHVRVVTNIIINNNYYYLIIIIICSTLIIIIMKGGVQAHLSRMVLAFGLISVTASRQYIWLSASVSPTPTCMASLLLNLEKHSWASRKPPPLMECMSSPILHTSDHSWHVFQSHQPLQSCLKPSSLPESSLY